MADVADAVVVHSVVPRDVDASGLNVDPAPSVASPVVAVPDGPCQIPVGAVPVSQAPPVVAASVGPISTPTPILGGVFGQATATHEEASPLDYLSGAAKGFTASGGLEPVGSSRAPSVPLKVVFQ